MVILISAGCWCHRKPANRPDEFGGARWPATCSLESQLVTERIQWNARNAWRVSAQVWLAGASVPEHGAFGMFDILKHSPSVFPNFSVQSGLQSQFDKFDKFYGICQVLSGLDGDALNEERSTESTATLFRSPQKPCSPGKPVGAEEFMPKLGNTFEQKARWMKFLAFPVWWYLFDCLISMWHRLCLLYDTSTSVQYTIIYMWYIYIYIYILYSHSRSPPGIYNR